MTLHPQNHNQNDKYIEIFWKTLSISVIFFFLIMSAVFAVKYFNVSLFVLQPTETPKEEPPVVVEIPKEDYNQALSKITTPDERIDYILNIIFCYFILEI